jgi:hypothetical protein
VELGVLGAGALDEVDQLHFSHPGLTAELVQGAAAIKSETPQSQYGKFKVTAAADVPPGFYEVFARGRNGLSNSRVLWVTSIAQQPAAAQTGTGMAPPEIPLGTAWHDRFQTQPNRYTLNLEAAQSVRVTVLDAQLDSRGIAVLRLLDPAGKRITETRSIGLQSARLQHTAAVAGAYTLEIHDAIYRAGEPYFYAVLAEDASSSPSAGTLAAKPPEIVSRHQRGAGQVAVASPLEGVALAHILTGAPTAAELVGNPMPVEPPCLIAGEFTEELPVPACEFEAKAGQVWWIDVASRMLGSLTDVQLDVFRVTEVEVAATPDAANAEAGSASDAASKQTKLERVVEQDDAGVLGSAPARMLRPDPSVRFQAPADGRYRIVLRDSVTGKRPPQSRSFLISVREPQPALAAIGLWVTPTNAPANFQPFGNRLLRGDRAAMRIIVDRRHGLAGAIEVTASELPAGVTCPPLILQPDQSEGHLIFSAAVDAVEVTAPIAVHAKLVSDPAIQSEVLSASVTWGPEPAWNAVTARLGAQHLLAITALDEAPLTISVREGETATMARGGKLPLKAALTRREGGKDRVVLRPQSLPAKVTIAEFPVEPNVEENTGELVIAPDAAVGPATIWFQCETKIKLRNNPQVLERAEAEKTRLEQLVADPANESDKAALEAALKAATERVEQLKPQVAEKELATFLPTNLIQLRIVEAPFDVAPLEPLAATRDQQQEIKLQITRQFEFEGAIDVQLATDPKPAWLELTLKPIAEKESEAVLGVKVAADAPAGEHTLQLKLAYKFNNHDLSLSWPMILRISE